MREQIVEALAELRALWRNEAEMHQIELLEHKVFDMVIFIQKKIENGTINQEFLSVAPQDFLYNNEFTFERKKISKFIGFSIDIYHLP